MKIVVIVGPTGVGKTKLSIELAKYLDAVVMNGDSMQVYRGLDIGTAKIKEEEKDGIEHYLFDIVSVNDNYTIYDYQRDGRKLLDEWKKENRNVVIVGGSGLYLKSLLYDYKFNEEENLDNFDNLTNEEILREIEKVHKTDIHINNRKRLIRELNKIKNNSVIQSDINKPLYDFITIGLTSDRDTLYDVVNKRVDLMFSDGLVEEVQSFYEKNIRSKAIKTGIGYKELYDYFDNKISLEEARELIKKNTRHFIKRQYTFFNNQMQVNWINTNFDNFNETIDKAKELIKEQD
ncbi:MAG: tRNA (adenosine(37)-N6)-dimethylallyltransferase MiaA [Bacilli bacterium]|nr:tRNA (adenosine(37)-N6)-dimethylallyltransferase MiaA [Bacilli bacterium]